MSNAQAAATAAHSPQSTIEQRLVDLESRLAFQEHALSEMSDALAASRSEVARQTDVLRRALHDLGQLRAALHADAAHETPPPHW